MKRFTAAIFAAALLLTACGNDKSDGNDEKSVKEEVTSSSESETETEAPTDEEETETTAEMETTTEKSEETTTKAEKTEPKKETTTKKSEEKKKPVVADEAETAEVQKVYEEFSDAIRNRDNDKLAENSDLNMYYWASYGEVADDKKVSETLVENDLEDHIYSMISDEDLDIDTIEKCGDDVLENIRSVLNSNDIGENMDKFYDVDSAYKVTSKSGSYMYVLHVNGEWRTDITIMPYLKMMDSLDSLTVEWEAKSSAVGIYTAFMLIPTTSTPDDGTYIITSSDWKANKTPSWLDADSIKNSYGSSDLESGIWALQIVCKNGKADAKQLYYAPSADGTLIIGYPTEYTGSNNKTAGNDLSGLF